jgi:hypothetical protein
VVVVEARAAGQLRGQVAHQVAARREPLEPGVHLGLGLLGVAEVGQEQAPVARHDGGAVGAGEAGQPADVDQVGDQQRVQLAPLQDLGQPVGAALGHQPNASLSICRARR